MIQSASRRLCRRFIRTCQAGLGGRQYSATAEVQGILTAYSRLVAEGRIQADPTQLAAVETLQQLQEVLVKQVQENVLHAQQQQQQQPAGVGAFTVDVNAGQDAAPSITPGSSSSSSSSTSTSTSTSSGTGTSSSSSSSRLPVQGAYLWGPVGSGKTLLMDLFLKTLPAAQIPHAAQPNSSQTSSSSSSSSSSSDSMLLHVEAERLHFHTFMLGVHHQLHQLQQALPTVVGTSRAGLPVYRRALPPEDPILTIARNTAASLDLLCLDELHVTDVADAMLLGRLFDGLLRGGVCVVFTSNRPVRELYKGGLSRTYFEPFIQLVDERLIQLRVSGGRDYRTAGRQQQQQQQGAVAAEGVTGPNTTPAAAAAAAAAAAHQGLWLAGPGSNATLQQQWQQLAQQQQQTQQQAQTPAGEVGTALLAGAPTTIPLPFGRSLWVSRALVHAQQAQQAHQQRQQQRQPGQQPLPQQQLAGGQQCQQEDQHHHQQQHQQHQQRLAGAYFTFDELCGSGGSRPSLSLSGALSANDYLALVQHCGGLFVEGVPQLTPAHRDQARRWVTLVDLLYEASTLHPGSVRLSVSAEVEPQELFRPLLGAAAVQGVNPNLGRSGTKLDVKALIQEAKARQGLTQPEVVDSAVAGEDATVGGSHSQPGAAAAAAAGTAAAGSAGDGAAVVDRAASSSSSAIGESSPASATQQQQQQQQQQRQRQQLPAPPSALLAEEVLMYHRASSRLVELCTVQPAHPPAE